MNTFLINYLCLRKVTTCDLCPMQPAVSSLLPECVLHVPEVRQTVHGDGEALNGHQRFQEGNVTL